jgi:hypothetical protein
MRSSLQQPARRSLVERDTATAGRGRTITIIAAGLFLAVSAGSAAAQETAAPPATQKPLVIEPIPSPFVIAPEYKVTEVDGDWRQLAGVYAGRLFDEQLLVAGAVYSLVDGPDRTDLTYGGLLIGWSTPEARLRFGARALIGGGRSTLPLTLTRDVRFGTRSDPRLVRPGTTVTPQTVTVSARDDFAVIEPVGNVVTQVTDHIGVDLSVGYRWTGYENVLGDRLEGATGSIAVRFGW